MYFTDFSKVKMIFPGHMNVVDKLQLNTTVLPAANFYCYEHVTCFYNFSCSSCLNVIYKPFNVKVDILLAT